MSEKVTSDKRTRILQAAIKVFSQKGFHQAKVEEIAEQAEVGKGTVYEYFKSKEELFIEMFISGSNEYTQKVSGELKQAKSAQDKLFVIVTNHFEFMKKNCDLARVIMQQHTEKGKNLHEWVHKQRAEMIKTLEGIILEGIANGEFKVSNPPITAALIFGMIAASGGMLIFSPKAPNLEDILATLKEILTKGIIIEQ